MRDLISVPELSKPEVQAGWGSWLARLSPAAQPEPGLSLGRAGGNRLQFLATTNPAPSVAEGEGCGVLFDGWLYNRNELTSHLRLPTASDAELVLQAYAKWGEGLVHHLKGVFALCLWDGEREVFLGVRDAVGVVPLFYAEVGQTLLLSTSLDTLLQHPTVPHDLDRLALAEFLLHRTPEIEETFFAGIRRVPPGHVLRQSHGNRRLYRYWDPVPENGDISWLGEDDLEKFDFLLEQAVSRCLQLGQAGIFLSGGLDSCTVATAAAEAGRKRGLTSPFALSYRLPDPEWQEEPVLKGLAAGLGLPQVYMGFDEAVGPKGMLLASLELNRARPAPLLNCFLPAFLTLAKEGKENGCQIILTGDGGDEWFRHLSHIASNLMQEGDVKNLYPLWRGLLPSREGSVYDLSREVLWAGGVKPLWSKTKAQIAFTLAPDRVRARERQHFVDTLPDWFAPSPNLRHDLQQRYGVYRERVRRSRRFYPYALREVFDRVVTSMDRELVFDEGRRLGLRILSPLWDPDLVEFLIRTPFHLRNRQGHSKGLLREYLHPRFPQLGFDRQKKITPDTFYASRMAEEGGRVWQAMDDFTGLADLGIVEPKAANLRVETFLTEKSTDVSEAAWLWNMLSLEFWVQPRLSS